MKPFGYATVAVSLSAAFCLAVLPRPALGAGSSQTVDCPLGDVAKVLEQVARAQRHPTSGRSVKEVKKSTRNDVLYIQLVVGERSQSYDVYSTFAFTKSTESTTTFTLNVVPVSRGRAGDVARARDLPWAKDVARSLAGKCKATDWSTKRVERLEAATATGQVTAPSKLCEVVGGQWHEGRFTSFSTPRRLEYRDDTPRYYKEHSIWDLSGGVWVNACTVDGLAFGPLVVSGNGHTLVSASYEKGLLDGEVSIRSANTGRLRRQVSYRAGELHGDRVEYDETGRPWRYLKYEMGELLGCAGACAKHDGRPVVLPTQPSRFATQNFYSRMEEARAEEASSIRAAQAAEAARIEEKRRQDSARLARSQAAGVSRAHSMAFRFIDESCVGTRLVEPELEDDGWFYTSGTTACPEHIDFIGKSIMVRKRVAVEIAPSEDGSWVSSWGVSYSDY